MTTQVIARHFHESRLYFLGFFLLGVGLFLALRIVGLGGLEAVPGQVYQRVGWVSVPMSALALLLAWASWRHGVAVATGGDLGTCVLASLNIVALAAEPLGLLGSASGIYTAMTNDYLGMSEVAAQAAKDAAIGTALFSTMVGLVLGLSAELQLVWWRKRLADKEEGDA